MVIATTDFCMHRIDNTLITDIKPNIVHHTNSKYMRMHWKKPKWPQYFAVSGRMRGSSIRERHSAFSEKMALINFMTPKFKAYWPIPSSWKFTPAVYTYALTKSYFIRPMLLKHTEVIQFKVHESVRVNVLRKRQPTRCHTKHVREQRMLITSHSLSAQECEAFPLRNRWRSQTDKFPFVCDSACSTREAFFPGQHCEKSFSTCALPIYSISQDNTLSSFQWCIPSGCWPCRTLWIAMESQTRSCPSHCIGGRRKSGPKSQRVVSNSNEYSFVSTEGTNVYYKTLVFSDKGESISATSEILSEVDASVSTQHVSHFSLHLGQLAI